jgi:hypothetical protein
LPVSVDSLAEVDDLFARSRSAEGRADVRCGWCGGVAALLRREPAREWFKGHACRRSQSKRARGYLADVVVPSRRVLLADVLPAHLNISWPRDLTDGSSIESLKVMPKRIRKRAHRLAVPGYRPGVFAGTPENRVPHFIGWADELAVDLLFQAGKISGLTVRRVAVGADRALRVAA